MAAATPPTEILMSFGREGGREGERERKRDNLRVRPGEEERRQIREGEDRGKAWEDYRGVG